MNGLFSPNDLRTLRNLKVKKNVQMRTNKETWVDGVRRNLQYKWYSMILNVWTTILKDLELLSLFVGIRKECDSKMWKFIFSRGHKDLMLSRHLVDLHLVCFYCLYHLTFLIHVKIVCLISKYSCVFHGLYFIREICSVNCPWLES